MHKRAMIAAGPSLSVDVVGEIVRNAVAPVFLLSGICAFLNVCTSRLSRIVGRSREIEPKLLGSRGVEHDRWVGELKVLDRRMSLVSGAIFLSVLSAILVCAVVSLLFAASLTNRHYGTAIAWLFIASMLSIGAGFAVFLAETWVGSRAVRVRSELLRHTVDENE